MAFTKITNAGFGLTTGTLVGVAASFSSTVSVGGTLTYEDVTNVDSVGLITARSGISITSGDLTLPDAIIHDGDTNTKVRFPAADTFTVETAGSERLRIDSSGRVKIEQSSADKQFRVISADSSGASMLFQNSTTGTGSGDGLYLGIDTTETGYLWHFENNPLVLGTNNTESMRIDSSGRLLLGTTTEGRATATDNLTIADSGDCGITIRSGASNDGAIDFSDATSGNGEYAGQILYDHDSNFMRFMTASTERARIDANGNLQVSVGQFTVGTTASTGLQFINDGTFGTLQSAPLKFRTNSAERMRLDTSGRLLIGATSSRGGNFNNGSGVDSQFLLEGTSFITSFANIVRNTNDANCGGIAISKSRGTSVGSNTIVQSGDKLGEFAFQGSDGSKLVAAAEIECEVDGTPGSSDMPGRLIFRTTADGGSSPVERMRIDSNGTIHMGDRASAGNAAHFSTATVNISKSDDLATSFSKAACFLHIGNASSTLNGVYPIGFGFSTNDRTHLPAYIQYITEDAGGAEHGPITFGTRDVTTDTAPTERMRVQSNGRVAIGMNAPAGQFHVEQDSGVLPGMYLDGNNGNYSATLSYLRVSRGNNSGYDFLACQSAYTGSTDNEFRLRGDGNGYADDSWNGGGADYAEYFEWSDGNTEAEDRRGISVVLDGDKIREAVTGEEPIGVISGNPSVVGDAGWNKWSGKYLRDDYGSYVRDENGHRQLSSDFDPDVEYVPREDRPEWDTVGLMGKLRIRKGQVTGARWIKMRDVSNTVEEWLVR